MKKTEPIHYASLTDEELKKIRNKDTVHCVLLVVFGTIIYSFALVWILQLCGFFAGGMSGVSQLIISLTVKFGSNEEIKDFLSGNLGTLIILLNIPLLVFGWRGVSKKFVLLTLISLILQFILSNILSKYSISPFVYLLQNDEGLIEFFNEGNKVFMNASSAYAKEIVNNFITQMQPGTRILLAIFGGIICAIGCGMCLRGGGSTGGMDIIANYLYSKKQISFTKFQTIFDASIIAMSSLINVENVMYTLLRLFMYSIALKAFYKSYDTYRIEIVTEHADELTEVILKHFRHGLTIFKCIGGYTKKEKNTIVIYASEFETKTYVNYIKDLDPAAFVTISVASIERSNFVHKTI